MKEMRLPSRAAQEQKERLHHGGCPKKDGKRWKEEMHQDALRLCCHYLIVLAIFDILFCKTFILICSYSCLCTLSFGLMNNQFCCAHSQVALLGLGHISNIHAHSQSVSHRTHSVELILSQSSARFPLIGLIFPSNFCMFWHFICYFLNSATLL